MIKIVYGIGGFNPNLPNNNIMSEEIILDDIDTFSMKLSRDQAKLTLKNKGLLKAVEDIIANYPTDDDGTDAEIVIMWNEAPYFHRTNPILVRFCKEKLGLDDAGIDELFYII